MIARVLIVAGSDSGGGAGIQADIKTVTALGGYAMTAVTALTAQSTQGVFGVLPVAPAFIQQQMRIVRDDIGCDAVKTGMLHSSNVIGAVAEVLQESPPPILVVDPVMVAQSGDSLLQDDAVATLKDRLLPLATLITPNLPEAERLLGREIRGVSAMQQAALDLLALGPGAVLLKGGHMDGDTLTDVLAEESGVTPFEASRIATVHCHGTGCTLASAITTGLAQGLAPKEAVMRARSYLRAALRSAPGLGKGQGPVNHGHTLRPFPPD
jgi:hydroxymethylpyrimidine/phosphomethylpyrimidine kinase